MENTPRSGTAKYVDILAGLENHTDYLRQIAEVEATVAQIDYDKPLPSEPLETLDEMLNFNGTEVPARFSGIVHQIDDEDDIIDGPIILDQPVIFGGANYYFVNETPRIFFDLRDETTDPQTCYAARFESILRLHCEKKDIAELFARHTLVSRGMITNPEFLDSDLETQEELLKSMAMACFDELLPAIDMTNSSIECTKFYNHIDKPNESELVLDEVDQADQYFEDRTAVTGIIVGVIYPEVVQRGRAFETEEDFTYGGVPCLTVRDDNAGVTTFIPIDCIEKIETND